MRGSGLGVRCALFVAVAAGCGSTSDDDPEDTLGGSTTSGSSDTDDSTDTDDSGSTSGTTTGPAPTTTPPPTSDTVTASETNSGGGPSGPSFERDVLPIFEDSCARSTCHGSAEFPEVTEYFSIVDAPSSVSGVALVEPGSSETSYLWHRLNGTGSEVGGIDARMPPGGGLPSEDIDLIGEWIDRGAPR